MIIGYCFDLSEPFILTELMEKGSALDVLREGFRLTVEQKLQMAGLRVYPLRTMHAILMDVYTVALRLRCRYGVLAQEESSSFGLKGGEPFR